MSWRISVLAFLLVSFACKKSKLAGIAVDADQIQNEYLINSKELKSILENEHIKILDFRKKEFYNKEHIAGALHIWRSDIEDSSYPYKGMMPSTKQIESLFSSLGISNKDTIVVYDNNGLCEASRLWWILQNYNFKNIKMLQGGLEAWKAIKGKVNNELQKVVKTEFKLSEKPLMQYAVSKEQVLQALNKNVLIVDTRTIGEFSGEQQKKGASKAGRIPKSIHIDWAEAINYNGDQLLKSLDILANIYAKKLNRTKNDSIILYCHSGVRSAHTTFVLTQLLGYKNVKNYDGSWTEWSYFDELPFKNNHITTIN